MSDTSCLLLLKWNHQVRLHDWQHCSADHRHTASETNIRAGEMIKNSFFFKSSFENDVSDLITITRLTFSLAGGQVPSSWQLWADGGNPHCQVIVLIFLFFSIHISLPCANDKLYYNFTVLCFCRHHNIQLITFTFCCNLYKTLHKHVIFIRLSLNTFPTGYAFLCPAS